MSAQTPAILISEVGPRDGLQMINSIMQTDHKKQWIKAEWQAGVREIEVCSFVPPKIGPNMSDATEIVNYARGLNGLTVAVLVPNFTGYLRAVDAGAHKITIPLSVSEAHNQANLRKSHAQSLDEIKQICAHRDQLPSSGQPVIEAALSTAFGCTISGTVPCDEVVMLSWQVMDAGVDEVGISDTTGMANPTQIRNVFTRVHQEIGIPAASSVHLHNTRGMGLANVVAALEVNVTTFDASLAGLGGCPFAPGASGNIVTEDLVYMLQEMGLDTGVDLQKLLNARRILADAIPDEPLYGFIAGIL